MELEIASPNEKEKMQMKQYQAQIAPVAPPEKGIGEQFGDMAKQRAMTGALDAGQAALTGGIKSALAPTVASGVEGGAVLGAGAGGAGAMTALGTAMPYVGAGLLTGKALGLFSHGGHIGPLSPMYQMGEVMYQAEGTKPDYLDLDGDGNKTEPMKKAAKSKKGPLYKAKGSKGVYGMGYSIPNPFVTEAELFKLYDDMSSRPGVKGTVLPSYEEFKKQQGLRFNEGGQVPPTEGSEPVPMPIMRPVPIPIMKPNIMGMKYLQENPQDAAMSLEGYEAILIDPLMTENK